MDHFFVFARYALDDRFFTYCCAGSDDFAKSLSSCLRAVLKYWYEYHDFNVLRHMGMIEDT